MCKDTKPQSFFFIASSANIRSSHGFLGDRLKKGSPYAIGPLSVCPVLSVLSVCDVRALWPNGRTDQDETWHAGRPRPYPHCVRWGPSSPLPKRHSPPTIFGPYLLRPNGCMDQDVHWYGARPRSRRLCVRSVSYTHLTLPTILRV